MKYSDLLRRKEKLEKNKEARFYRIAQRFSILSLLAA